MDLADPFYANQLEYSLRKDDEAVAPIINKNNI